MRPGSVPVAFLSLALAACASSGATTDAGAPPGDAGADVATRADATIPTTPSGVTAAWCAAGVDMAAAGQLAGETLTVHGSTATPTSVMAGPCNNYVTGQTVYRYRVRGDQVWLRATTNLPGGTDLLDTTVWFLQGPCSESARVLACNDDDSSAPDNRLGASTVAAGPFACGTELALVVGAYARARRGAEARGEYNLAVTETPSAAAGARCDSTVPGACVTGYECAADSPTGGTCVAPTPEAEPNDTPATAGAPRAFGTPTAIHAAIQPAGDVDCFALAIPEGAALFAEASDGRGSCGADLRMDVYRLGEEYPFDGDDDSGRASDFACPRVDPSDHADLRSMPAGTYVVCVRAAESADAPPTVTLDQYSLHIAPAAEAPAATTATP